LGMPLGGNFNTTIQTEPKFARFLNWAFACFIRNTTILKKISKIQ